MNDQTRDKTQRTLNSATLYRAVAEADEALRSRSEYDFLDRNERRFALLCWALERSADLPPGNDVGSSNINLHGALRALNDITKG